MTTLTAQYEACDLEADGIQNIVDRAEAAKRSSTDWRPDLDIERYGVRVANLRAAARTLFWMSKNETEIRAYVAKQKEMAG